MSSRIHNFSSDNKNLIAEINLLVGPAIGFFKALFDKPIGSQRLIATKSSDALTKLFSLDNYPNACNIEIRPHGIIIHFRSRLEMYVWVIPANHLKVKSVGNEWEIRDHTDYITLSALNGGKLDHQFLERIKELCNDDPINE